MSSLRLIYLHSRKENTVRYIAALVGTAEGGSRVLHHPLSLSLSLSFVFPHMDVISCNLSGFVKWQPDRETEELCFVARTWHSATRSLWLTRYALTNNMTAQRLHMLHVWSLGSWFCEAAFSPHSCRASPAYYCTFYMLNVNQADKSLKRRAGVGDRGNLRIDVGSTLACYPATVKCPKRRSVKLGWDGWKGRLWKAKGPYRSFKEKERSKCSENKPQKLLQPLGNLLKAHKSKVCYNTWSYNGDPFHRFFLFFFFAEHFFLFFKTGRGKLMRDWQP